MMGNGKIGMPQPVSAVHANVIRISLRRDTDLRQ